MKSTRQTKPKTKTNKTKTKTKVKQPVQNDEYEEIEMHDEDYKDYGEEEELQKPKLPQGFFEIEAVRKKRVKKGKKEYLVKWLDWPESANTWEPVENLDAVTDFIKAFEESSKSGKRVKNDEYEEIEMHGEDYEDYEEEDELKQPKLPEGFFEIEAVRKKRVKKGKKEYLVKWLDWPESTNTWEPVENLDAVTDLIESYEESSKSGKRRSNKKRKPKNQNISRNATFVVSALNLNVTEEPLQSVHIQEDLGTEDVSPENGVSKDVETALIPVSLRIGSQRRKSCAVKRFKQATNLALTTNLVGKATDTSDVDAGLYVDHHSAATPESAEFIKIVKLVNYTRCMENGIEDVCVSLLVRRSDGEEVVVDNKYLKENNPDLLINYYEKLLCYDSP